MEYGIECKYFNVHLTANLKYEKECYVYQTRTFINIIVGQLAGEAAMKKYNQNRKLLSVSNPISAKLSSRHHVSIEPELCDEEMRSSKREEIVMG